MKKLIFLCIASLMATLMWTPGNAQIVIGPQDGTTSTFPIMGNYGYSYTQQLIYQSEINAAGDITSISFYLDSGSSTSSSNDWTVYLGTTSKTEFTSSSDWVPSSALTQVYSGTVTFPAAGNQMVITFSPAFTYNNTDNLVVAVDENQLSYDFGISFGKTADLGVDRSIYYRNDSTNPDPDSPPTNPGYSGGTNSYINNVTLGGIQQACPAPTDLAVVSTTTTSADISWTANGSANQYTIKYSDTPNFDPETAGMSASGDGSGTATLDDNGNGLSPNTTYEFYVQANCDGGDGDSSFAGPVEFTTDCLPVPTVDLPYTEDFDTYGTGSDAFPSCWERPVTYTSGSVWPSIVSYFSSTSSPNSLKFRSAVGTPTYAVSPSFAEDIQNLRVSFMLKREGTSSGTIDIGVMSDPLDNTTFELVQTIDPDNTDFNAYTFDLNTVLLTGGNNYIALRHNSDANNWFYWLDDFMVETIPTCVKPTDLAADFNLADTSADISWTTGANTSDVYVAEAGDPAPDENATVDSGNMDVTSPHHLDNLTADTHYEVYVRADCGQDGKSTWAGPVALYTGYCEPTVASQPDWTGEIDTDGAVSDISYSAPYAPGAYVDKTDKIIKAYAGQEFEMSVEYTYSTQNKVAVWVDWDKNGNFDNDEESDEKIFFESNGTTPKTFTFVVPSKDNGQYRLRVRGAYTNNGSLEPCGNESEGSTVDFTFEVVDPPTCIKPDNVSVTGITADEAIITWTPNANSDIYVADVEAGDPDPDGSTTPDQGNVDVTSPKTLSLNANTAYKVFVRSNCGQDGVSTWAGPVSFSTACEATDSFPFTETFEDDSQSFGCWTQEYVTGTQEWYLDDGGGNGVSLAHNGTSNALFRASADNGNTTKLISPAFDFSNQDQMQLTFWYSNEEWFGSQSELRVYYKTSSGGTWTLIPGAEYTSSVNAWTEVELILPNSADASEYYIAFEGVNQYSYGITLDDITIAAEPLCTAPTLALVAQDVNEDPITECIDEGGEYYVLATLAGGEGNTSYNVTANSGTPVEIAADGSYTFGPFVIGTEVTITAQGVQDDACSVSEAISPDMCVECVNTSNFGSADVSTPGVKQISTCNYLQEYSIISGIVSGYEYQFTGAENTSGNLAFITVRSGTYDGPIIEAGMSPLNVIALNGDNLFVHWNTDAQCGTSSVCATTTAECITCGIVSGYVYESGVWTPSDPNGSATASDNIMVMDGEASFSQDIEVNDIKVMSDATLNVEHKLTTHGDITVNSDATLNIEGVLTINGDITIDESSAPGHMIFKSTATSDGELAAVPSGSTITGDVTVERYMSAHRSYRFVSSAVTTTGSIHDNWQEGVNNTGTNYQDDNKDPHQGFGTHITGSTNGDDGFDATISGNYSLFTLNFATPQRFDPVTSTNGMLNAGDDYLLFVRGSRAIDLTDPTPTADETVLRTTGSLKTGDFTKSLGNVDAEKYIAVANPYQSAVDLKKILSSSSSSVNLNTNYVYIYDPSKGSVGGYVTVDLTSAVAEVDMVPAEEYQYIQPGQAVQVKVENTGPTSILFKESYKEPGMHTSTFSNENPLEDNAHINGHLYTAVKYASGEKMHDNFSILFNQSFDNALNAMDAAKPMNFTENMGIGTPSQAYSIERRELPIENEDIALFNTNYENQDYTLVLEVSEFEGTTPYLVDTYTGEQTELQAGENVISFSVDQNVAGSIVSNRFYIHFGPSTLSVDNNQADYGIQLYPNPTESGAAFYVTAGQFEGQNVSVSITDLLGKTVYNTTKQFNVGKIAIQTDSPLGSGVYFVRIAQDGKTVNKRLVVK